MGRVIAYVRVSTIKQETDNQLTGIREYADREHLQITEIVGETISGYKSTITERKFSEVLADLQAGDTLIVSETSRISRRLLDVLNTIQNLIDRGVAVITVKENIVFRDDINSKVLAFAFGLSAEIERSLISSRTREALARKKAEGVKLGRPVGSTSVEKLKLHGKDEQIITMLLNGASRNYVANELAVNRNTLTKYIKLREIHKEVLWRRHEKTTNKSK
ncbi:resolvase [Gordonia terrae C-6]|uniref:Resolvase n=1 Tax=Gordonia terrae C-6 TaxID=1316928 RepID=R7YCQ7_9ACTN|nr:recombinase family protein [Gordonia terrae]EON33786.1 resolvase [Gordonia terrae C-6]